MAYELKFPVQAGDAAPLTRIADAVRVISERTKISAGELKLWTEYVQKGTQEGFTLSRSLQQAEQAFYKSSGALGKFTVQLRDYINEQRKAEQQTQQTERAFARMATYFTTSQAGISLPFGARGALAGLVPGGGLGLGIAAGVGGALLVANQIREITNSTAEYGREISNLAMKTGLSIQEAQLFSRTAEITGQNVNMLVMQVRTLSKALVENSDEGRRAKSVLQEFLSPQVIQRLPFMPVGEALRTVYGGIGGIQNPIEQRRIASSLLGRGGLESLPFAAELNRGEAGIRAAGGIFSDEEIQKAKEYKRQTELLGIQYDALKMQIGLALIPAMREVVSFLANFSHSALIGAPQGFLGPTELRQRVPGLALPGVPGAEQLREPFDRAAAARIQALASRGTTPLEGLHLQLRQAETELAAAANRNDDKAYEVAQRKVAALKDQVKASEEYLRIAKEISTLETRIELRNFQGPFGAATAEMVQKLRQTRDPEQRARFTQLFQQQMFGQLTEVGPFVGVPQMRGGIRQQELERSTGIIPQEDMDRMRAGRLNAREFEEQLKEDIRTGQELRRIQGEGDRSLGRLSIERQGRIAAIGAATPAEAARAEYQTRIQLARDLEQQELSGLAQITDARQREIEFSRIERDLRVEGGKAALDYELKITELRDRQQKQDEQTIRNLAGGGVGALISGGGRGLGQFARGQFTGLASTVAGNAAVTAFDALGVGTHIFQGGVLGSLFKGTALGPDPTANLKVATDLNTQATNNNTAAMIAWNRAMGVQTATPAGVPDLGGIPISLDRIPGLGTLFGGGAAGVMGSIPGVGAAMNAINGTVGNVLLGATNPWAVLTGGSIQTGPGTATTASSLGISGDIGAAIGLAAAGLSIAQGARSIARGGASGISGGIAQIAGTAAVLDPEPISKAVLASVAVISGVVATVLGDPKVRRARDEQRRLEAYQFYAPTPINANMDVGGFATGYDRFGNLRVATGVGPYPSGVEEPYYDFRHHVLVPGRVVSPIGGSGPGVPPTVNINAMDSQSFTDFARRNPHGFADGVIRAINTHGRTDIVEAIRPLL